MHDLDKTLGHSSMETSLEGFELAGLGEQEFQGESFEFQAEHEVLGETELTELAAELLEVSNEEELNHFLGGLIRKAASVVGKAVKSPVGQAIGGMLKGVAKNALPMVGSALGNMVLPGVGGAIGGKLASAAGSAFGLELEGLSQEDRELEMAKQFVRLAADTTQRAVQAPSAANPTAVAKQALAQAAAKYAPGLMQQGGISAGGQSGRWVRRGRKVVLYGI
jgi:hypothetical protein